MPTITQGALLFFFPRILSRTWPKKNAFFFQRVGTVRSRSLAVGIESVLERAVSALFPAHATIGCETSRTRSSGRIRTRSNYEARADAFRRSLPLRGSQEPRLVIFARTARSSRPNATWQKGRSWERGNASGTAQARFAPRTESRTEKDARPGARLRRGGPQEVWKEEVSGTGRRGSTTQARLKGRTFILDSIHATLTYSASSLVRIPSGREASKCRSGLEKKPRAAPRVCLLKFAP